MIAKALGRGQTARTVLGASLLALATLASMTHVSDVRAQAPAAGAAQAAQAGEVDFVRGTASLQRTGEPSRILGKGLALRQGDVVSTGPNSYAILKFSDGTRMTVRPDTRFLIQVYQFRPQAAENESAGSMVLSLFRGGLRTLTGLIPKRDNDAARVVTPTATVGIRGTDFDMRLCGTDCVQEQQSARAAARQGNVPASARIVDLRGTARAVNANNERRLLALGGPIYPGDTIESQAGGYLVLVFRDESRMTIQPNSRVKVDDFVFDSLNPKEGRFFVNLLKGGLRAFTGLIGKASVSNVAYRTPTATVGIRGSGGDLCVGCVNDGEELTATVWDGTFVINTDPARCTGGAAVCTAELGVGETALVNEQGNAVTKVPTPIYMNFTTPRPDRVEYDMARLFGLNPVDDASQGLFVLVRDGHITILSAGQILELGRGETAYADGRILVRPLTVPIFLDLDRTPLPDANSPGSSGSSGSIAGAILSGGVFMCRG